MSTHEPGAEDATDAFVDGDRTFVRGTAQAALRHRDFRIVWSGMFASNIGTWMQNVLLGAYGYTLTHSTRYVGLIYSSRSSARCCFSRNARWGARRRARPPRLLLVVPAAAARLLDRARGPRRVVAPERGAASSLCPRHRHRQRAQRAGDRARSSRRSCRSADLPGAVSLQSVQMNLSRVIGPAIGARDLRGRRGCAGLRHQRCDLPLRDRRARSSPTIHRAPSRPGAEGIMARSLRVPDRGRRPARSAASS